ncbi:MAG: hypothetical protein XD36_1887, partial [Halomonas sp. 54_146]
DRQCQGIEATDNEAGTREVTTWESATTISDLVVGGCQERFVASFYQGAL